MKTLVREENRILESGKNPRRDFIRKGIIAGAITSVAGINLITSCKKSNEEDISPSEDLMREHGLLNRILLIYDTCKSNLMNKIPFQLDALNNSAQIIRTFIEEYHEKLEENFLFPRFEKANKLTSLVEVLRSQHKAGRTITDQIIQISSMENLSEEDSEQLIKLLNDFNVMYRPHEAREDTILFPALREIITESEYFALGEDFEDKEHELFGEDGFEKEVEKVATLEKQLGIYELSIFTPDLT
jgi:hemerythrin-like domain-containing protein